MSQLDVMLVKGPSLGHYTAQVHAASVRRVAADCSITIL